MGDQPWEGNCSCTAANCRNYYSLSRKEGTRAASWASDFESWVSSPTSAKVQNMPVYPRGSCKVSENSSQEAIAACSLAFRPEEQPQGISLFLSQTRCQTCLAELGSLVKPLHPVSCSSFCGHCLSVDRHILIPCLGYYKIILQWPWGCWYLFGVVILFLLDKYPVMDLLHLMVGSYVCNFLPGSILIPLVQFSSV